MKRHPEKKTFQHLSFLCVWPFSSMHRSNWTQRSAFEGNGKKRLLRPRVTRYWTRFNGALLSGGLFFVNILRAVRLGGCHSAGVWGALPIRHLFAWRALAWPDWQSGSSSEITGNLSSFPPRPRGRICPRCGWVTEKLPFVEPDRFRRGFEKVLSTWLTAHCVNSQQHNMHKN